MDRRRELAAHDDPNLRIFPEVTTNEIGRFHLKRLVPERSYNASVYLGFGRSGGLAFTGLKIGPGAKQNLGDLRLDKPTDAKR